VVTTPGTGAYGNDAFGFGEFPGKFGMAVFSRLPIDDKHARTFQHFLWKDMPGALLPDDPATPAPHDWYSPDEQAIFRLSSKSHWDVPIEVGHGEEIHFLVSHPTPPVFDGPEDRNGTRNHDEIRFWADYIDPAASGYIHDDDARRGGLKRGQHFGPAGPDQLDAQGRPGVRHRRLRRHVAGQPARGLRPADRATKIADAFVFWPRSSDPLFPLVGTFAGLPNGNGFPSSDHRLVAVDVKPPR
jgi:Endonuclease/Exonuclease/phosphatase family